jgi:hypothetical protein
MSRSSNHMTRKPILKSPKRLLAALATALTVGFLPAAVHAAGYSYQQHIVNAGVLVNGADPAPYVFYVLNNRPDVKPSDVTLINPLAPANAAPNTAAYWEVQLNALSDSQLSEYNVLYLRADNVKFGPVVNERLRRFVDNGGQLIVEYGTSTSPVVPGLFTGTGPAAGSGIVGLPAVGTGSLRHPITSQPYFFTSQDFLGLGNVANSVTFVNTEYGNLFSPALSDTTGQVVSAAQIGAGQVVVSALNLGQLISVHNAATFANADLYTAPSSDLKVLANILAWSEAHPNQNKTSHGNASNAGLASFSPAWQVPVAGTTAPSGAAVWGNFVFVTDAAGTLHAYDAFPSENLTGNASAAGAESAVSQYPTTSYDEIWNKSLSAGASAPTLAAFGGTNYVFVEAANGSVVAYNAVTGAAGPALTQPTPPSAYSATSYPQLLAPVAPAPTYSDGRVYAGQANGLLDVYDLNEGSSVAVPLDPSVTGSEPVTGPPAVGLIQDGDSSVMVAIVPTNSNIYSVLLGARNEPLNPFYRNGAQTGYNINRQGRYDLGNIFADLNTVPNLLAYDYNGNVQATLPNSTAPSPQDPLFSITNNIGYYTDWDMDFASAVGTGTTSNPVNLNYVSASSLAALTQGGTPTSALMSAPAIDRQGDYYYTESSGTNSYLVGVHNAALYTNVHLKFRFRIPTTADGVAPLSWNYLDADGVNYNNLIGYQFVGAPVVDDQDNVYVVATNGTNATVLCFRGDQAISAAPDATSLLPGQDLTQATITQPDENVTGQNNTIYPGPDTNQGTRNAKYGQYITAVPTGISLSSLSFYNFGKSGRTPREIAGDLSEPQPVLATDKGGTGVGPTTLYMHTNLAWYMTPFPVHGAISGNEPISGLSQVGTSLFLTDGISLYRLATAPTIGVGKEVTSPQYMPSVTPIGLGAVGSGPAAGVGAVGAPPSIGGNVMVINGATGLAALTRQVTVIADNNRILGVDGDGSAVWGVDSTTRTDPASGVSTKVSFSHPTALSQFAVNDYLVADTGNNRCVRFDSGGTVQWELTRFQDPNGLMAAGQPLTLSQPSSVVVRVFPIPATYPPNLYPGGTATYYLVADSGNDRILEVADVVDANGVLQLNHVLTWVSHTKDADGRNYRYGSAAYYPDPATIQYTANSIAPIGLHIAATVTNVRLAPLAVQTTAAGGMKLGPVSGDAPGGSIVVFNYPASPQSPQPFNNLSAVPSDLAFTTAGFYAASVGANGLAYTPFTIRNPRFLQLYTPPASAVSPVTTIAPFDFLYADDNGAFDLTYDATKAAFVAEPDRLQFVTSAYQGMNYQTTGASPVTIPVPAFGVSNTITDNATGAVVYANLRGTLPFLPTCIQALSTDSPPTGMSGTVTRRYLITQSYGQGELGNVFMNTTGTAPNTTTSTIGKLGGEIFEVDVSAPVNGSGTVTATPTVSTPGGFAGNETLSHPDLTGPLTQPTFGVRLP